MKPANPGRILVVLGILFIPAIAYYLISRGKNNFKKLEIYGPREVLAPRDSNGLKVVDTLYHTIPAFRFTDQFGRTVSDSDLAGSIYVADFFFTSCKSICPEMSEQLRSLQTRFQPDTLFKIVSFSVDPLRDSVPALREYAMKYNAIPGKWYFLTGDKDKLYDLARNGFFLAAIQGSKNSDDFNHSEQLVLIDREKRIRGYYDGTDPREVDRLKDEILVLEWEYKNE